MTLLIKLKLYKLRMINLMKLICLKLRMKNLTKEKLIFLCLIVLLTTNYLPNKEVKALKKINETIKTYKKLIELN